VLFISRINGLYVKSTPVKLPHSALYLTKKKRRMPVMGVEESLT